MTDWITLCPMLRLLLNDPDGLRYAPDALALAGELALSTYNQRLGTDCSVAGLADAAETTLPAAHQAIFLQGAALFALPLVEGDQPARAALHAAAFESGLAAARLQGLHQSAVLPYAAWGRMRRG